MKAEARRKNIVARLISEGGPVSGGALAEEFGVSRQIIVADVALLRASGFPIRSEHRGYVLAREERPGLTRRIVCRHAKEDVCKEFYAIVDRGGRVRDVTVEHSVYGSISAPLLISSRTDADDFVRKTALSGASHLSDLTGGIHVHTLSVDSEEAFASICAALTDLGILIDHD